jgi:carbon-monoxide dehydrogenase medium subunit
MKAPAFQYACPRSLPETFELLERYGEGARVLAGGQSLMATLNMRLSAPEILVDINAIDGLAGISYANGVLRIGAMTRHAEVERSPLVERHAPLIAQAMPHVAHLAIRNRGTFGGSLAFADPSAEMPACAMALGARLVLESAQGRRTVDAEAFFQGFYRTALMPGELLIAAEIPAAGPNTRQRFAELARRHGDYALAGVALNVTMRAGLLSTVRLVYLSMGDRPMLAKHAGNALEGQPNSAAVRDAAAQALERDLDPPEDFNASSEMRLHLARVMTRRILEGIGS